MNLSIKQIRYFVAAADFGKVSAAAQELNVSQSAVTAAIQQLETGLGVKLFTRNPSGVSLTAEGGRFLRHARDIVAAVNQAVQSPLTTDTAITGRVKVGVSYTVVGYFLPRHLARFERTFPRITIELRELPRDTVEKGLNSGELDIAVMLVSNLRDKENLTHETLFRSKRRLWLPLDHHLLKADSVPLADIAQEPYVMLTVDEAHQTAHNYWKGTGLQPRTIFNTFSVEAIRSMVAASRGVTILSDMVYRPWSLEGQRIETRNVDADIPTMDVGLAWQRDMQLSPAAKTFHDFLSLAFGGAAQGYGE